MYQTRIQLTWRMCVLAFKMYSHLIELVWRNALRDATGIYICNIVYRWCDGECMLAMSIRIRLNAIAHICLGQFVTTVWKHSANIMCNAHTNTQHLTQPNTRAQHAQSYPLYTPLWFMGLDDCGTRLAGRQNLQVNLNVAISTHTIQYSTPHRRPKQHTHAHATQLHINWTRGGAYTRKNVSASTLSASVLCWWLHGIVSAAHMAAAAAVADMVAGCSPYVVYSQKKSQLWRQTDADAHTSQRNLHVII